MKPSTLVRAAATAMPVLPDRVHTHARLEALGEAARRTPLAIERGDVALALGRMAREHLLVLDGALEEALAGLARERAVVEAADLVAADGTRAHRAGAVSVGEQLRHPAVRARVVRRHVLLLKLMLLLLSQYVHALDIDKHGRLLLTEMVLLMMQM